MNNDKEIGKYLENFNYKLDTNHTYKYNEFYILE